jgi:hypothetical protein
MPARRHLHFLPADRPAVDAIRIRLGRAALIEALTWSGPDPTVHYRGSQAPMTFARESS